MRSTLLLSALAMVSSAATAAPPNIVLLSVDTLRADHLGCYGYKLDTSPRIDQFAKQALLFEDCVCEVPLTNPSFGAMLSSRYPRTTGTVRNGLKMPASVPLITQAFRTAGYQTACVQSNWTLRAGLSRLERGFDIYRDDFETKRWGVMKGERYADKVTQVAIEILEDRDKDAPSSTGSTTPTPTPLTASTRNSTPPDANCGASAATTGSPSNTTPRSPSPTTTSAVCSTPSPRRTPSSFSSPTTAKASTNTTTSAMAAASTRPAYTCP